ncbi:hypothetical protein [Nocardia sp. NPDC003963]
MRARDNRSSWDDYYDDDDKFYPPSTKKANKFEPPQKSALIVFEIAEDRLPVKLTLRRDWKNSFAPSEYGKSLMEAYRHALYQRSLQMIELGSAGKPSTPALRDIIPTLLQTRTYIEYRGTLDRLVGDATVEIHGLGVNELDEPAMTIRANRSMITDIYFDPDWALRADISTISHDIIYCANQLRTAKPRLAVDEYLARETDSQLTERLAAHISRIRQE